MYERASEQFVEVAGNEHHEIFTCCGRGMRFFVEVSSGAVRREPTRDASCLLQLGQRDGDSSFFPLLIQEAATTEDAVEHALSSNCIL